MQTLITANTLTFTKPNCGCGIVSSKQRKQFLSRMKRKSKTQKKQSIRTKKLLVIT